MNMDLIYYWPELGYYALNEVFTEPKIDPSAAADTFDIGRPVYDCDSYLSERFDLIRWGVGDSLVFQSVQPVSSSPPRSTLSPRGKTPFPPISGGAKNTM